MIALVLIALLSLALTASMKRFQFEQLRTKGAKYLVFFSSRSLKTREKYISFAKFELFFSSRSLKQYISLYIF